MNPTELKVEEAIAKMDEPVKDAPVVDKPVEPVAPEDPKDPSKDEEEGFSADEFGEDVEPDTIDTANLDDESKYIIDNLPLITARLKTSSGYKDVQVKSYSQLPEEFEFASKRDEIAFNNALTAQEYRARDLQKQFQQSKQDMSTKEFEQRENASLRDDIAELQKAGQLPKFKVAPDSAEFDKDPAAKEVQKVLEFMNTKNQEYLQAYNAGRAYRHIGFQEAFSMFKPANTNSAQDREDEERTTVAKNLTSRQGLSAEKMHRATVKSGTRIDDIIARYDQEL
jgi:hypothetical protein